MQKYIVKTAQFKPTGKKRVQIQEVYMHADNANNLRKNLIAKVKNGKKSVKFNVWTVIGNTSYGDELGSLFYIPEYELKFAWVVSKKGIVTEYDVSQKTGKISNPRRI